MKEIETAVVKEPSVFKPLKFYHIQTFEKLSLNYSFYNIWYNVCKYRGQASYLKLGDILIRFSGFREKFNAGFHFCLYVLYL